MVDVREHVVFGPQADSPAWYECRTDYFSWRADDLRYRVANDGITTLGQQYAQYVRTNWLDVTERAPLEIIDDAELNRLSAIERYELKSPWKRTDEGVSFVSSDSYLRPELPSLPPGAREDDIYLGTPRIVRRQLTLDLPQDWPCELWDETHQLDGVKYVTRLTAEGKRRLVLNQELTIDSRTTPAASVGRYRALIAALGEKGDVSLWHTGVWGHGGEAAPLEETFGMRALRRVLGGVWAVIAIVMILRAFNLTG
jgi:hypothetical protein